MLNSRFYFSTNFYFFWKEARDCGMVIWKIINSNKRYKSRYTSGFFFIHNEMNTKVAIQGIKGSFHHQVALEYYAQEKEVEECLSFEEVVCKDISSQYAADRHVLGRSRLSVFRLLCILFQFFFHLVISFLQFSTWRFGSADCMSLLRCRQQ